MEKIKIKLENLDSATNKYNNEVLNNELDNYITSANLHNLHKERIILYISSLPNNKEQEQLIKSIHMHYKIK